MIEWKSIKDHKPTDFVKTEEWTYEVYVIVFPKVEGSDDTRDAAYRVKSGEFIMTNNWL